MEDSEVVEKGPCDNCGGWLSNVLYSDGHRWCFRCSTLIPAEGNSVPGIHKSKKPFSETQAELAELLEGSDYRALDGWGITQATCRAADYRTKVVSKDKGFHIAVYKNKRGQPIWAKVRVVSPDNDKVDFFSIGDKSQVTLQGIETAGNGGKMVVVTEGEKDRLAGLQLWNNRFPVWSLPFGGDSSDDAFAGALEELSRYDQVVLALDMDEVGREGCERLAKMLPPGKAYIADFPEKDLHDTFKKAGADVAKRCLYNAAPYQPGGIIDADAVDDKLDEGPQWGLTLPPEMALLYEWTYGFKGGQVWVGGGGTSVGKSDWSAQIVAHMIRPVEDGGNGTRTALLNYESEDTDTLITVLSKLWGHNFSIPDPEDGSENLYWKPEDLAAAREYRRDKCAKLFINDAEGICTWDAIKERIRYMHFAYGVKFFVVDNMAAMVAQFSDKTAELDRIMAEAKALARELNIILFFWSHLTRPAEGRNHEEGGRVRTSQFRGSNSISMWADVVVGIERNQQAEDEEERCTATLRTLKIRKAGRNTGRTFQLIYNSITGVLEEPARKFKEEEPEEVSLPDEE